MKKLFVSMMVLAGMTACSSEDSITGEAAAEQPAAVKTYQVSIPASFGGDGQTRAVTFDGTTSSSTFAETEEVYVYNATTEEVLEGYLTPTDISADGKSCKLTGMLTGTISDGNSLTLLYNLTEYYSDPTWCNFNYDGQDCTQSGVVDGATATVTASGDFAGGILTTSATASFRNVQSMFRFKFEDEGDDPITVATLRIKSTGWDIAAQYWPLAAEDSRYGSSDMTVTPSMPTSDYLYVAICINEDEDPSALEFTATDADGNEYKGTKLAPSGGFKNGKYYYNASAITLTKQAALFAPTITWTSVLNGEPVSPDIYNRYNVCGPWNNDTDSDGPSEITISGTSRGYCFSLNNGGTIHLNGLTATYDGNNDEFIYSGSNLTLDISGANSITTKNIEAICVDGTLKLSGNGTLTVTANYADRYGLFASTNYNDENNSDPSALAADGYTVTRSDRTDNADGTYTWTYTVAPAQ
jgi:hypothetical protein